MKPLPEFATDKARTEWITEHAEYFTVVRFRNRAYERAEALNLPDAIKAAKHLVSVDPSARLLIYAVYGVHSCYVTTIQKES